MGLFLLLAAVGQEPSDEEIRRWVADLTSEYLEERIEAANKLGKAGARAIPHVVSLLDHEEPSVRRTALGVLRSLGDTSQVNRVIRMFEETDSEDLRAACFEYVAQAGKEAEDFFIRTLRIRGPFYRKGSLQALKNARSVKSLPVVVETYQAEEDPALRRLSFEVVRACGREGKPFLLKFLNDADAGIRRQAVADLRDVHDDRTVSEIGARLRVEEEESVLREIFAYLGNVPKEKAEDLLIESLKHKMQFVQEQAVEALAKVRSEKALDPILALAQTRDDAALKKRCIRYFAAFPEKTEVHLLRLLDDENDGIRSDVIDHLKGKKTPAVTAKMREIFRKDPAKGVRRLAFQYFTALGPDAMEVWLEGLEDELVEIRQEAVTALRKALRPESIPALVARLDQETDEAIQRALLGALAAFGEPAVRALEAAAGPDTKKKYLETVKTFMVRVRVETELARWIRKDANGNVRSGTFPGQFDGLRESWGEAEETVLLEIAAGEEYRPLLEELEDVTADLADLALLALAALARPSTKEALASHWEAEKKREPPNHTRRMLLALALAKLGDPGPVEELEKELLQVIASYPKESAVDAAQDLTNLALLRKRMGNLQGAREALESACKLESDQAAIIFYNLACVCARMGDKDAALGHLRTALEQGFGSKEWIEIDRDLDSLRDSREYQELLSTRRYFEPN